MKPTLQLKLSHQLKLTPQLQQSIRLLQLSTIELNEEIERIVQENPLLEMQEDSFVSVNDDSSSENHNDIHGENEVLRTDDSEDSVTFEEAVAEHKNGAIKVAPFFDGSNTISGDDSCPTPDRPLRRILKGDALSQQLRANPIRFSKITCLLGCDPRLNLRFNCSHILPRTLGPPLEEGRRLLLEQAKDLAQGLEQTRDLCGLAAIRFCCQIEKHRQRFSRIEIIIHGLLEALSRRGRPVNRFNRSGSDVTQSSIEPRKRTSRFDEMGIRIVKGALALFLRHNYIPTPYSIYQGISKLSPGCVLTVSLSRRHPQIVPYWSDKQAIERGRAHPFEGNDSAAISELEGLLTTTIGQQMVADVPLGAFLSGGVDSSTVVALMQAQSSRPVKTFTIGFDEEGYDEAPYAQSVARHLGTDHIELYVLPKEAMNVIPRLPALYDAPVADSSQIPPFLFSQLARRHVTVSLSGDGGDELFGGYNR